MKEQKQNKHETESPTLAEPSSPSPLNGKVIEKWSDLEKIMEESDIFVDHKTVVSYADIWSSKADFYSCAQAYKYLTGEAYLAHALLNDICPTCCFIAAEFFVKSGAIKKANDAWQVSMKNEEPKLYLDVLQKGIEEYKEYMSEETIGKLENKLGIKIK